MSWSQSFLNYAVQMAKLYQSSPDQVLSTLGNASIHESLNITYQQLVREKEIKPLEDLDAHRKEKLWNQSKKYSEEKKARMMICRTIYLLELLTEQK